MKRILALILVAVLALSLAACGERSGKGSAGGGLIKVGIVNNPPSESGYRAANVADFERVFLKLTVIKYRHTTVLKMMNS